MPIHGSVFSVVQISTSRPRYSASFFSILDLAVPRGLQRRLVVRPEDLLLPAYVKMVPREMFRHGRLPPRIEVGVQPDLVEDPQPTVEVEVFIPFVEAAALLSSLDQRRGQAAVSAGEDAFHIGFTRVMGLQVDPRPPRL